MENFKPNTLQEKTGQAATKEMHTGGLSQTVWLSDWHTGSPRPDSACRDVSSGLIVV